MKTYMLELKFHENLTLKVEHDVLSLPYSGQNFVNRDKFDN